ncbi:MAG: DMT family transporter [Rubrivivax sp.]
MPVDAETRRATRRGIRLMMAGMACFIVNDAIVKLVSASLPAGQLIFVRGLMASALVLLALRRSGVPLAPRQLLRGAVPLRAALDAAATFSYLLSLFHLPLANATAINMASPLMITAIAVGALGARVTWRQVLAIVAGFAGVLLVIQPSGAGFNAWAWLCLLAALLHALRDLVTTRIAHEVPAIGITLATALAVTAVAAAVMLVQGWQPLEARPFALLAAAAVFLAGGYHLVIRATRAGELALVAPFRYSGLLLAVALGWVLWGDVPNALAWAGIVLVMGAGWYLLRHR